MAETNVNIGRLERLTSSHILLLEGEVDLDTSLILHTKDGDFNVGDELYNFRGDNVRLYIIKEDVDIIESED